MTPVQTINSPIGNSQDFDGTDDFVDLGESQWDGSPSGHTYSFWFHRQGSGVAGPQHEAPAPLAAVLAASPYFSFTVAFTS